MDLSFEQIQLESIITRIPQYVFWKDKNSRYLGCNENFARICGLQHASEIVGKTDHDLPWGKDLADTYLAEDKEIILHGSSIHNKEVPLIREDGSERIISIDKVPLRDNNGNIIGVVGIYSDITEQKQTENALRIAKEKAETADRAKSRFLSVASHELRIPLTGIMGLVSFLKEDNLTRDEEKEYVNLLEDSSQHLFTLVNDILDFAKLEADKYELQSAIFDLKDLIEDIFKGSNANAKNKGLELKINLDNTIPYQLLGDPQALRRVLMNLINNAIKFTEKGSITVDIRYLEQNVHSITLQFVVRDTGRGIPADKQHIIFERFQQLEDTYVRAGSRGGTGLGLAIVQELVELMGGKIWVESKLGEGAAFYFDLNFASPLISEEKNPWAAYAVKPKILVVLDTLNSTLARNHFKNTPYFTTSSHEAIAELINAQHHGDPYQIIMLEEKLKQNPMDLFKEIQLNTKLHQPMPILLTTQPTESDLQKDLFIGINEHQPPEQFEIQLASAWNRWLTLDQQKPPAISKEIRNKRILLIDDDEIVQFVHKKMLTELTPHVDSASNAIEALAKLDRDYDIILVDIGLPDLSGYELIKQIRARPDKIAQASIIALTGYTGDEERNACLEAGANEVAIKPIKREALQDILERYSN